MHRRLISAAIALAFTATLPVHAAPAHKARKASPAARAAADAPAATPAGAGKQDTPTQLPRGVVPTHYDVSLEPDAATSTFVVARSKSPSAKNSR
jgi:aminopeptidase N